MRDLTDAMQDYLREIYNLRLEGRRATTSAIAESMGVRPPSATATGSVTTVLTIGN